MIEIRGEEPGDRSGLRRLYELAFPDGPEADLVDRLRDSGGLYLGFAAVAEDRVLGHILFTRATLDPSGLAGMGLAPMAVLPSHQRQGIGSRLVRAGLEAVGRSGYPYVIVLGHPGFYPRFGFEPASRQGLRSQWPGVPDEAFMALVFDRDALPPAGGIARYRPEFDAAM